MDIEFLRKNYGAGVESWPTVQVPWKLFRLHCERTLDLRSAESWHQFAADMYLCAGCLCGNSEALMLLNAELRTSAAKAIRRVSSNADFADEALQSLRHKLLVGPQPKLQRYAARGPLAAWLSITATRTALDLLRSQKGRRVVSDLSEQLACDDACSTKNLVRSQYGEAFQQALKQAVAALSPRDRNVLRLHLVSGCSIDRLSSMYGVNRSTCARWLSKSRVKIFRFVQKEMKSNFNLSDAEFTSIARGVQSQLVLDIGIRTTLASFEVSSTVHSLK